MKEMIAIGANDSVMIFQSIGIPSYIITEEVALKKKIDEIVDDAKIIFISEALEPLLTDIRKKYIERTYPIILSLPMHGEKSTIGLEKLKKDVERAIGISLF